MKTKVIYLVSIVSVLVLVFFVMEGLTSVQNFAFAQVSSITIITTTDDNTSLTGSEYSITPNPFTGKDSYAIKDDAMKDFEKDKKGIITLTGIKNGKYTITQLSALLGYDADKVSKIFEINDSSEVVVFTNKVTNSSVKSLDKINDITYTAKFVCGTIMGNEGPLRPGHYDSDISVINKQNYPIKILWNVVTNDGTTSHSIIKELESEQSTGIVCNDINELVDFDINQKLTEGFVILRIPMELQGSANTATIRNISQDNINLLDVQVFYTANALPTLPHEIVFDKISFYILKDGTSKIPVNDFRELFDVTLPSNPNEISNTELRVKKILAQKYGIEQDELEKVIIRIKNISIGVGVLLDDHAISLNIVKPQINQ